MGSTNFVWNKIERAKRGPEGELQGRGEYKIAWSDFARAQRALVASLRDETSNP